MSHEPITDARCRMCWESAQDCECPIVSAIMPTRGRPELAAQAVKCFQNQTWHKRELVILDDAECLSFPQPPPPQDTRYAVIGGHLPIGAKRNALCEMARGQIICHWDDDDWSGPTRMADIVQAFQDTVGAYVFGYYSMIFWDSVERQAWEYSWRRPYAIGTSLAYWKSWWGAHPFPEKSFMEDNDFIMQAMSVLHSEPARERMVARYHGGNTTGREPNGAWFRSPQWKRCDPSVLPPEFPR